MVNDNYVIKSGTVFGFTAGQIVSREELLAKAGSEQEIARLSIEGAIDVAHPTGEVKACDPT